MKKLWWVIGILVTLLLIVYGGGSWYFSSIVIDADTGSIDDSISRMEDMGVHFDAYPSL